MLDQRKLPAGQGPNKNLYLRWNGNGPNPTSYTVRKKRADRPMPSNWPVMVTRHINAQLRLRQLPPLTAHISPESHNPESLLLSGRQQLLDKGEQRRLANGTRSSLLVGINFYDRWLQYSLGSKRVLEVERYDRGGVTYVRTNLSMAQSQHDLCPPLLADIEGIVPAHFKTYVYRRHLLGVRVSCYGDSKRPCQCKHLVVKYLPVMWISQ